MEAEESAIDARPARSSSPLAGTSGWRGLADGLAAACRVPKECLLQLRALCCWALQGGKAGEQVLLASSGALPLSELYREAAQHGAIPVLGMLLIKMPGGRSPAALAAAMRQLAPGRLPDMHVVDVLEFDSATEEASSWALCSQRPAACRAALPAGTPHPCLGNLRRLSLAHSPSAACRCPSCRRCASCCLQTTASISSCTAECGACPTAACCCTSAARTRTKPGGCSRARLQSRGLHTGGCVCEGIRVHVSAGRGRRWLLPCWLPTLLLCWCGAVIAAPALLLPRRRCSCSCLRCHSRLV